MAQYTVNHNGNYGIKGETILGFLFTPQMMISIHFRSKKCSSERSPQKYSAPIPNHHLDVSNPVVNIMVYKLPTSTPQRNISLMFSFGSSTSNNGEFRVWGTSIGFFFASPASAVCPTSITAGDLVGGVFNSQPMKNCPSCIYGIAGPLALQNVLELYMYSIIHIRKYIKKCIYIYMIYRKINIYIYILRSIYIYIFTEN